MKKLLSMLLVFVMTFSLSIPSAWAAEVGKAGASQTTTNGQYENGVWKPGVGDGTVTHHTEDLDLTLSKTAKATEESNVFDITMQVQTVTKTTMVPPGAAATVLVVDVSNSMDESASHGVTRLEAAKNAAKSFLEKYAGKDASSSRMLSIVVFGTSSKTHLAWSNVAGGAGQNNYDAARQAIESIEMNFKNRPSGDGAKAYKDSGGTNLEAGIQLAANLINMPSVSNVASKNIITLTDGTPTYRLAEKADKGSTECLGIKKKGTLFGRWEEYVDGSGSEGSYKNNNAASAAANSAKSANASVYTVCFGVADKPCYGEDHPTVGEFLRDSIASPADAEHKYAYDAKNADDLNAAFEAITDSVISGADGSGWVVEDPMGDLITVESVAGQSPDVVVTPDGKALDWKLSNPVVTQEGDKTIYTYEITYRVKLDTTAEGFDETKFYPANGETYLHIGDQTVAFPVPGVKGELPYYTVTYQRGDHGTLANQDQDGNVVHPNLKKNTETPKAPVVTAEEGYYFVGWAPAVAPTVTENATYVAQYAPKQEITVKAKSAEVPYTGEEQSVSGFEQTSFTIGGKTYTVEGLTASAKGTNAGSYESKVTGTPVVMCDGQDVTEQFTVHTVDGMLTIKKLPVTVTINGNTATEKYDGTEKSVQGYTVQVDNPLYKEASIQFTGEDVAKGTDVGKYPMDLDEKQFSNTDANFDVTFKVNDGSLNITPADAVVVTITGHKATQMYNGKEQMVTGYDVTTDNKLYTQKDFTFTGTAKALGTDAGSYPMGLTEKDFKNTNKNFEKVVFQVTDGGLEITKCDVVLTSDSASKTYDGTKLTAEKVTVSGSGFVKGEGASYSEFASITDVGTKDNTFRYTLNENTKADNYNITQKFGALQVTKNANAIVITANSATKMYDGTPLTDNGFTYTEGVLAKGDKLTAVVKGSAANVGDKGVNHVESYKIMRGEQDVTANYTFGKSVDGKLTITKRDVVLTSDSASKTYDGTKLTAEKVTVSGSGFVKGEGASYSGFASITDVGSVKNTFEYALNQDTNANNYDIQVVEGKLEILPVKNEIVITANSATKMYDGTPLTDNGFTYTEGVLAKGDKLTAVVKGSATNVGDKGVNHVESYRVMRGDKDVTANYTFGKSVDGKLAITKRDVVLTSDSASKTYDGMKLTAEKVTVSGSGFVKGEGASYSGFASITDVGSVKNTFEYALNKNTNAANYDIQVVEGKLEILPVDSKLVITAASDTKMYDGTALTNDGFTYTEGILADGDKLTAVVKGSATNVGDKGVNHVESYRVMRGDKDVTANYTFGKSVDGKLEITKRDVVLTSASAEKVYDGTALTAEKVEVSGHGFVDGEGAEYHDFASITNVGTKENTFQYTLKENTKEGNYNITVVPGTLQVTENANAIVIKADSATKMYDGKVLTAPKYTVEGKLADGDKLTAVVKGSATNVGDEGVNHVESYKIMRGDKDVTAYYTNIITEDGKLEITKRDVVLTSASAEKVYDGTALTAEKVEVSGHGFVDGEGAEYHNFASITNVGTKENTFQYTLKENTKEANYNITVVPGTLQVTENANAIVIKADSATKMYDGKALTAPEYTVEGKLADGDKLTAVVKGSATNVGDEGVNHVESYKIMRGDKDVTAYYTNITTEDGKLTITKRDVVLTSTSAEKVYDGTPLSKEEVKADGFVDGEGAEYHDFASITNVGTKTNTFEYTLKGNTKADNYNITKEFGTLQVTAAQNAIVIKANDAAKVYDGTPLTDGGYTIKGDLIKGDKLTAVVKGSATNVGDEGVNHVESYKVMRGDKDVTANYTGITTEDGKLEITKRDVVLTSADASKVYDGTSLSKREVKADGFVDGEGAEYHDFASITNVGTKDNTFKYTLNENTKADNYNITKKFGTLTIAAIDQELQVLAGSAERIYNGETLTNAKYTFTKDVLAKGDTLTAVVEGSALHVGDAGRNEVSKVTIVNEKGEDVTANYANITTADGTLTIMPCTVTIVSASAEKVYDGKALSAEKVTYKGDGFVGEEGVVCTDFASIIDVGTKDNTFQYTLKDGTMEKDYTIQTSYGTLKVVPNANEIVITANSATKMYDGTPLTDDGFTYTKGILAKGDKLVVDVEGSATNVGDKGVNHVESYKVMRGDKDVTANYTFGESVDGKLEITKRDVVLTSDSASKVYDGTPLSAENVTVSGSGFVDGEGASYSNFASITNKGSVKNTFEYALNKNTNAANYDIQVVEGKLEILPVDSKLVITAASDTKMYDGTALTNDGFTYTEGILAKGDKLVVDVEGSATNVGDKGVNHVESYKVMRGDKDVTDNYTFGESVDGKLTITKRDVVLTSADAAKVYDGTPLRAEKVTVSGHGFVDGEGAEYHDFASITNVGTKENTFQYTLNDKTDAGNYNITVVPGTLQVSANANVIVIKADSSAKVYDGTALTDDGYAVKGDLAKGDKLVAEVKGSATNVGDKGVNHVESYKVMHGDQDVTANYTGITTEDGKLEITKRDVVLTSADASKVYDGTPLSKKEVKADGFVDGEGAEYHDFASITNVGTKENTFKYTLNENTKASNYNIAVVPGTLRVTAAENAIVITADSNTKMYDGTALSDDGYTVHGDLIEGDELIAVVKGHATNVNDKGINHVESYKVMRDGVDVTANYAGITTEDGKLEITKRDVVLTSASANKVYDGTALSAEQVDVSGSGFAKGEDASYSDFASITDVGTKDNTFQYTLNKNTDASNYDIQVVEGKLEILPVESKLVITANSDTKMYDGTALTNDGYTYTEGVLAEGDKLVVKVEGSATNVGDEGVNHVESYKVMRGDKDVTANYTGITTEDGTLEITKRDVTLTSASASKQYDGTPLTAEQVDVSGSGFAEGEGAVYSDFASITNAGQKENTFVYTLMDNTLADNYDITVVNGLLSVNKHTGAQLTAKGYTGVYDGAFHDGVSDKQIVGGVDSDTWTYTYSTDGKTFTAEMPQFKDVGSYTVYVKATNDNYEGDALVTTVPVKITPAVITVTADSHTIAAGDADPELTYQVDTSVDSETPAFSGTLVRDAGNTKGVYAIKQGTLALVDGEGFKASNYVLRYVPGELTILQRAMEVTKTVDKTKVCVGEEITYTITVTNTGDVDLKNVVLVDQMLQVEENIGTLAAGKSVTLKYTYVATEDDEGENLINIVVVTAEDGTTEQAESEATAVTPENPDTGDHSAMQLWMMSALVSAAGLVVLGSQRKKFMNKD